MINELGIYYQPGQAKQRAEACSRRLAFNMTILVVIVGAGLLLLGVGLYLWLTETDLELAARIFMLAITLPIPIVVTLVMTIIAFIANNKAKDDAALADGLAIGINRDGILINGQWLPWPEVGELKALSSRWGGSTRLSVNARSGNEFSMPLAYTDTMPAELDIAVRTLSAGRARVDLSRLDA